MKRAIIAILTLGACGAAAAAQQRPSAVPQSQPQLAAPQTSSRPGPLVNLGSGNKEPIKIDADKLEVFDKEQRAVFSGNVVAVQGESTVHCTELTVLYEQQRGQGSRARAAAGLSGASTARGPSRSCPRPRLRPATRPCSTVPPTASS
jgi:lipopolysaccharide export system protein LptA